MTLIPKVLPNNANAHTLTQIQPDSVTTSTISISFSLTRTHAHWPPVLPEVTPTISHPDSHRRSDKQPPPLPRAPCLTRCWYRQTFPKPPVPSRSRISQGPPAPGRSPGGRSMGREGKRPQVQPPFQGRFRAAEARASFFSRDVCITSGNCHTESSAPNFPNVPQAPQLGKGWGE